MFLSFCRKRRGLLLLALGVFAVCTVALVVGLYYGLNPARSATPVRPGDPSQPLPPSASPLGVFAHAAVATNGGPCAGIGRDVLLRNGSAVEAALAALFCEGVACPQSMGLGGGFHMTVYRRASRTAYSLDAREVAPAAATVDMYHGDQSLAQLGGLSVAVPGELRGYAALFNHTDFRSGNVQWSDLVEPTIKLCEEGVEVTPYLAGILKSKEAIIKQNPSLSEILVDNATGGVWLAGDKLRRPQLAETLRVISKEGPEALYTGSLVDGFVKDVRDLGGIITRQDMADYSVRWAEPAVARLDDGDLTAYSMPLSGSGHLVAFMLQVLDGFLPERPNVTAYHRVAEAMKFAYGRRTQLGDPAFVHSLDDLLSNLTSREYAEQIRAQINDSATWSDPAHYGAVVAQAGDHGTAHISVLAPNGDAVAVTSTINLLFGAGVRSTSTGIILNDEMDDFSAPNITNAYGLPPFPNNYIAPGKRPLSSMAPTVVVDGAGDVRLVVGAAGGTKITTATTLVAINNLWFNNTIKEAVDASRIHHQLLPMELQYEYGFLKQYVTGLRELGHEMLRLESAGSSVTAISRQDGQIYANADYRRNGSIAGF
ncbi:scoloptoxin SSD14-like [Bacillus rossius redtenbacheri]|uniref:scoloptoxin SSD14-like n=1 Tax=Bacillus rossius redtenbacheri TaxID=93214 RepID=UPI002FDEF3BA